MKKLQLFDQNHGLSPLQKCQFYLLFKSMFILSRKAFHLTRTSPNTFSWCIFYKNETLTKVHIFDQNLRLNPLDKCQCCGFLKPMFSLSRFIFTTYYMGIPGVTRGDTGLQGVTKNYTNFFSKPELSQILFLGLFCIKIKVEEISNF